MSTADQSTGPQVTILLQEAVRLKLSIPAEPVYVDNGVSGSASFRPAFDQLRAAIQAGEIAALLITKFDRLGRSARTLLEFYDLTQTFGVRVVVVDQGIDTATPVGRLARTFLAGMAEFERDLITERTQARMDSFKAGARTKSGRPPGRPRRDTAEKVAEAIRLRSLVPPTPRPVVAQRVNLPKETIRKAVREAARGAAASGGRGKPQIRFRPCEQAPSTLPRAVSIPRWGKPLTSRTRGPRRRQPPPFHR